MLRLHAPSALGPATRRLSPCLDGKRRKPQGGPFAVRGPFTRRGAVEPRLGQTIALDDAVTAGIHEGKTGLGEGNALLGGHSIPLRRLGEILRHAEALVVEQAEARLRQGDPLFGRLAIPQRRRDVIAGASLALMAKKAQVVLGLARPCSAKGRNRRSAVPWSPRWWAAKALSNAFLTFSNSTTSAIVEISARWSAVDFGPSPS